MKIQIIKIIPCFVAGFILSACVGAVNVPSSVAEKKTESEPIVLDPETILINRCIIDDNLKDSSCTPIVADKPCITDPFGVACDLTFANFYKTAQANRISFCRKNPTNNLCTGAVKNVCDKTPFDADLCFSTNAYYQTHESMCEADPTAPRCETTVRRVCSSDPLNAVLCFEDDTYNNSREQMCMHRNDGRCATTVSRFCDADPFNTAWCFRSNTYHSIHETTCADEPTSLRCATTISRVCGYNAFHGLCDDNPIYESVRINDCITAGNAGETRCTEAFVADSCVLNSFGANCDSESYLSEARINRVKFCSDNENVSDNLCMNADPCHIAPFSASCVSMTNYDNNRDKRLIYCRENDDNICANAITITCATTGNPFDVLCGDSQYQPLRTQRLDFCGILDNKNDGTCAVALSRPNIASFLQSFDAPLPVLSDAGNKHGFLRGTETGLDFGTFEHDNRFGGAPSILRLDFLRGNAKNGLAMYEKSDNGYFYAGIFSNTDLGSTLIKTSGGAQWNGSFRAIGSNNNADITSSGTNPRFTLIINFGAGDQAGTISGRASKRHTHEYYSLTGDFDSSGVITGIVYFGSGIGSSTRTNVGLNPGTLRGLIGELGAIAVFHSNNDGIGSVAYSGGFIARPPE